MTRYRTNGEILDILEADNQALLFINDMLVRASLITVDVLWMCREPRDFCELHSYLIDAFGAPPNQDPERATQGVLDELVAQGLLKAEA